MAISSVAVRTTNFTINQASWELRTAASERAKLLELGIVQVTGTAQSLGLGRPGALGVTPGGTSTPQRDDPGEPASNLVSALSWGTSPTAPSVYMRRWNSAATIGVGIIWTFPRGLVIPVSASIVVFNITTAVACDMYATTDD